MSSSSLPAVSFVIPLFNHLTQTQRMLDSLLHSVPAALDYEVILADDASTDGTAFWLATIDHPRIKTLRREVNRGYAANCNAAARLARSDILCFLNNDLLFETNWLSSMLWLLQSSRKVGVVGNVQRRLLDGAIDHTGVTLNMRGQLVHMVDSLGSIDSFNGRQAERLAVTGACMLLRRADFWACGGLNERYRNGAEDFDLCFKFRQRGLLTCVAMDSCVGHHVSMSRGINSDANERNSCLLFYRWRALLKHELAALWLPVLQQGGPYPEPVDELIDFALLSTPRLASLRTAEALLARQEVRWRQLFGDEQYFALN